jgi:serine/threonine-protein kinase
VSLGRVGPYRLIELVGQGGMGAVYRAHDTRQNRSVAFKVISRDQADEDRHRAQFLREAQLLSQLHHPNLSSVLDYGEIDDHLFLAMSFVEGKDTAALLRQRGPFAPEEALSYVSQIADALDAVHRIGIVHRDVKPSNIVIGPRGSAVLIDFGVATTVSERTEPWRTVGTPAYMAPEAIIGKPVDGRADIYSLGCVLFEFLTGQPAYSYASMPELIYHKLRGEPSRLRVVPQLDRILSRTMSSDPDSRVHSRVSRGVTRLRVWGARGCR